jgi:hypothetical protein
MSLAETKAQKIFHKEIIFFVNNNWKEDNFNLDSDLVKLNKAAQLFGNLIENKGKGKQLTEMMVFITSNRYSPTETNKTKVLRMLSKIEREDYIQTVKLKSKPEMNTRIKNKLGPLEKLKNIFSRN